MSKTKKPFASTQALGQLIAQYFKDTEGLYEVPQKEVKTTGRKPKITKEKVCIREPEPPTLTGLALYLGFNSRQEFEARETKGRYSALLKQARLRIEAIYEKKLHFHSSSGAVFALKNMGWNERGISEVKNAPANAVIKVEILPSGPELASAENEVAL